MKRPCVYILASKPYGTLYVGVTSDIGQRMAQHQQGLIEGFTKKYSIKTLVYYEMHDVMDAAFAREKRLKRWRREWKYRVIEQMNPQWQDLLDRETGEIAFGSTDEPQLEPDRCARSTPLDLDARQVDLDLGLVGVPEEVAEHGNHDDEHSDDE